MWHDARRFWGRSAARTAGLVLGCALVVALLVVNTHLLRSSLWFVPPAVQAEGAFVTLGAYSAEGRFAAASAADIRALDTMGFRGRYTLYGADQHDVELAGRTWPAAGVAFVSDGFFDLLDVRMALGAPLGTGRSGVVLDHEFWQRELGADRAVIGKSLQVAGTSLPIVGVAGPRFHGLGDRRPVLWIPERMRAACVQIAVEGEGVDLDAIKAVVAEQMPAYHALVKLEHPAEQEQLRAWKVRTAESVRTAVSGDGGGATEVTVGVNRRDFRPALLNGIDLVPDETGTIKRYLWLISGLSTILVVLAILNLAAYWSVRTTERSREIHIRSAMGARIGDLARLFAAEAAPFVAGVVTLAVPIAWLQWKTIHALEPFRGFLQNRLLHLGLRDFGPSLVVTLMIGAVGVLAPLLSMIRTSLRSNSVGPNAAASRWRLGIATVQWALVSVVAMLAAASLLSGYRMSHAGWGGDGDPLIVRLPWSETRQTLVDALRGSAAVAAVEVEPLGVLGAKHDAYVPGLDARGRRLAMYENVWSPAAIAELGLAVRAGRVFEENSEAEAMVSESYARALGLSPQALLNRRLVRIGTDGTELPALTIVGVLADVRYNSLRTPPEMVVYVPPAAGKHPSTLLLPHAQRGRIDAVLRELGARDRDVADSLAGVTSMRQLRDDSARTESLLCFATFAYALLALGFLMLGIVADARMQLAQRGRELALVVSLGARLGTAVIRFLRGPLVVAVTAVLLVLPFAAVSRSRWLSRFPMLLPSDIERIGLAVPLTVGVFSLALVILAAIRLRALSLSDLLRVER